jgi:hypothetical protein
VTAEQARVMAAITACRTAELGGRVYEYLRCGAIEFIYHYVHAVAISDCRPGRNADGQVSFSYYDDPAGGVKETLTLPALEFIPRFLLHFLPERFVCLRYYGLHHSAARQIKLPRAGAPGLAACIGKGG